MASTAKTLTFVIPAYNMESYLDRCVNSLLSASDISDLEVLIVDDGSKDGTLEYARKLERTNPGAVRAIHQENKGHGGAVNTGIAAATGMYVKVVDADDWVDPQAIDTVLATLRAQHDTDEPIDMLVTNYVYDKVAKRHKTVVNFRRVMEAGRVLGWDDLGKFGLAQYIIMHGAHLPHAGGARFRAEAAGAYVLRRFLLLVPAVPVGEAHPVPRCAVLPLLHRARGSERADRRDD